MRLYFHHVGQKGADEDFKKTVFARVPVSLVETSVPNSEPNKKLLLRQLHNAFPIGSFNCWGVPSGAAVVIRNLEVGDAVLLVETANEYGGSIPALGIVKAFVRHEFPSLSYALWGNSHFPFVFFFETERLELDWLDFVSALGYAQNFDPRGKFYAVADDRLAGLGGAPYYVDSLRQNRIGEAVPLYVATEYLRKSVNEAPADYQTKAEEELGNILQDSEAETPALTDDSRPEWTPTTVLPRDAAFRSQVKLIYGERCAVCGSNRYSPGGNPEVEGAHIYPRRLRGRDVIQNGLSLCRLHHWAFDCGWYSLSDDVTILVRTEMPDSPHFAFVKEYEGRRIAVPEDVRNHPHPVFLAAHRRLHGYA